MCLVLVEAWVVAFAILAEGLAVGALGLLALLLNLRNDHRDVNLDLDDNDDGGSVGLAQLVGCVFV